ncbi:preprotein translocase subunit SecE [Clostridium sp. Marseille-Q2269]|uniref:preprotein translocase subunit SecE n=1 Tax=Clostridium sp. Marseille-Q2269 TaxID=2942205 RepID=UPI002073D590|nr:preprotein translocase subunit SecE [Clostridium sp. Marseille-Q2269]
MATGKTTNNIASAKKKSSVGFFKDLKLEFKRITWAPKKDVKKATETVLVFCLIYMIVVGVFDYGFNNLFKLIFRL